MSFDMKTLVLLAMAQTAFGTPAAPVAATNAILCRGFTPQPIKAKYIDRALINGMKGSQGKIAAGEHIVFEFEVEFACSGTAGTAPKWSPLHLGCNHAETVTAVTSTAYALSGEDDGTYLTFLADLDGLQFKMTDARGSVSYALNSEDIPVMKYTFTGKYWPMTDTSFPTGISFTGYTKPLTVGAINTPTFTLGGVSLTVKTFSLDIGNQVVWKDWIGRAKATSNDRQAKANAVFELTTVAAKNWAEAARLGDDLALNIVHGINAGNIATLAAPKLQINADPSITDDSGTALISLSFDVKPSAGNDEVVLTLT